MKPCVHSKEQLFFLWSRSTVSLGGNVPSRTFHRGTEDMSVGDMLEGSLTVPVSLRTVTDHHHGGH